MPPSVHFVRALLSCLASGRPCVAVPLNAGQPLPELLHAVRDSASCAVLTDGPEPLVRRAAELAAEAGVPLCRVSDQLPDAPPCEQPLPGWRRDRDPAYIVFTSGTTGRPKGALVTHGNARSRCEAVARAWRLGPSDLVLNCLPLHHVHGLENCLLAPLHAGSSVLLNAQFQPDFVWQQLLEPGSNQVTVFMAVPTVYTKLLGCLGDGSLMRPAVRAACERRVRLMVSGSAPLPETVMRRWHEATGHWLLERYGMTEIGMALGNPIDGPRLPGCVGLPFPGVSVRIRHPETGRVLLTADSETVRVEAADGGVAAADEEVSGSLEVHGPLVFQEYVNRPAETAAEFSPDGWFRTGDTAAYSPGARSFRILGRTSVDIVKSGGYKISALEVEAAFLCHPAVAECAVVSLPDDTWGERLVLFAVPVAGSVVGDLGALQRWAEGRLAKYSWPRQLHVVGSLPRNAMGKVDKRQLKKMAAQAV